MVFLHAIETVHFQTPVLPNKNRSTLSSAAPNIKDQPRVGTEESPELKIPCLSERVQDMQRNTHL